MRSPLKLVLITGSLLAASLGAAASAGAATAPPPVMDTSVFACTNGVCEVGPGNVGMAFGAGLNVTGDGVSGKFYGDDFTMKVISGSLPPGLQLSLFSTEWTVSDAPTRAGSYPFTLQFSPTQDAPQSGPPGTQQLTITIGTGSSDRLANVKAAYNGHQFRLYVSAFDVNIRALYSVQVTSTGKQLIAPQPNGSAWNDGSLAMVAEVSDPCGTNNSCNLTVTDSLGSSVMVTLGPARY
jgi:hypothetical protein